jgi:hypothetical protein
MHLIGHSTAGLTVYLVCVHSFTTPYPVAAKHHDTELSYNIDELSAHV